MDDELNRIIGERRLTPLFQPLVRLRDRSIHGYEALIRGPSDSPLHAPLDLFDTATRVGRLAEVEFLARECSLEGFSRLDLPAKIFLNVSPECLLAPGHRGGRTRELIEGLGIDPRRVVIELTEQQPTHDIALMKRAIEHYRAMGFSIAIDDLGAGYSGLRLWCDLRPDYVKIDRHFIQGIHEDPAKRTFVRSIREIARALDCRVIAEGVECREELEVIERLGIDIVQGYWFAMPRSVPPRRIDEGLFPRAVPTRFDDDGGERVLSLVRETPSVPPHTRVEEVGEYFVADSRVHSIAVVEGGVPLGIVRRHQFMNTFLSRYGRDLHGRRPIEALMDSSPLLFSHDTTLEEVSRVVTGTADIHPDHEFIITENGGFRGVGRVMDLLRTITDQQIRYARYANPLTQLPGNVPINQRLGELLEREVEFVVCYADLDQFKPFNDRFGYARGDELIQLLADLLEEHADGEGEFVGHVGGDDFVMILFGDDWEMRCRRLLEAFGRRVEGFYTEEERARGGSDGIDRAGDTRFIPLVSLSLAAVRPDPLRCRSYHDVAALAAEAKKQAKRVAGSTLFIERRQGPEPRAWPLLDTRRWRHFPIESGAFP